MLYLDSSSDSYTPPYPHMYLGRKEELLSAIILETTQEKNPLTLFISEVSHLVVSNSLRTHGL